MALREEAYADGDALDAEASFGLTVPLIQDPSD
jgi:hypothetical protein